MDQVHQKREKFIQLTQKAILGDSKKNQAQNEKGKYTARVRIEKLLDPGSFVEMDQLAVHRCTNFNMDKTKVLGDGVITGIGTINGQKVAIFSQDSTCWGGALGERHAAKICKLMDLAVSCRFPIIGLNDSGGARIQEGVESLAGYAEIFYRNVVASGVVPQLSLILGPCAGGAVYSPALTDFIFMVDSISYMFVTGPDVIKTVTHESVTMDQLGGAQTHNETSGVAHFRSSTEDECFERVRELLFFLAPTSQNNSPKDSSVRINSKLKDIIPQNPKKPYEMDEIIVEIVDHHHFFEVQKDFAKNIICGFGKMDSQSVGIIANRPSVLAGVLDINSSSKAARFIRFCDAFNIPIITLVDVPGFLPGTQQEFGGIIRHGAKLLYAYSEASVPMITLITRKAYGGAYDVMASKHIRADINLAYPTAQIAVMGALGAVNILYRKELAQENPSKKDQFIQEYEENFDNPYKAAELGFIDEIILPENTRSKIISYLNILKTKQQISIPKKHGNIPL